MHQYKIPIHQLEGQDILTIEKIEECDPINFDGVHRHNFYEILSFTNVKKGDTHYIDFVAYPLSTNALYILKPGQVHKMLYKRQKGFMIAIYSDFFASSDINRFTSAAFPNEIKFDNPEDIMQASTLIGLIYNEHSYKKREVLLQSYLKSLIILLESHCKNRSENDLNDKQIYDFLNQVEIYYKVYRNVGFYAQQLSVSEKTLTRICLKYMGQTVKQTIQKRLLLEAKRKIATSGLSFQEIAFDLGFKDASYFTRFFKILCGKTPQDFKDSLF